MSQTKLIGEAEKSSPRRGTGPPNRINDLTYTEWMRFQKSFFWYESDQKLIDELIPFFTKARYPDGHVSRSLIVGFDSYEPERTKPPRIIDHARPDTDIATIATELQHARESGEYDFAFVDMRRALTRQEPDRKALTSCDSLFSSLRKLVKADRYCGMLARIEKPTDFPTPWSVALVGRAHLRLRDEKIALFHDSDTTYYCLFFQSNDDERPPSHLTRAELQLTSRPHAIPPWTTPKPPPRRKGELLHPAKFPETLVKQFIDLFTHAGDTVFDPMVGTGSTVLAALRSGRGGIGIDLIPKFLEIAKNRILNEFPSSLLESDAIPAYKLIEGDATKLSEIAPVQGTQVDYCITSPPYWSVLGNRGSEYQRSRRQRGLPLVYSEEKSDIGNVQDYDAFLRILVDTYDQVARLLKPGGYLTVVVKNLKRKHVVYPLSWDLMARLARIGGHYEYVGTTLWCQDDISVKPFALGTHWVSNTLHHYCLHFRRL